MTTETLAAWRDVMFEALAEMDAYDMETTSDAAAVIEFARNSQRNIEHALHKVEHSKVSDLERAKAAAALIAAACVNAEKLQRLGVPGPDADVERFEIALTMMKEVVADEQARRGPVRLAP